MPLYDLFQNAVEDQLPFVAYRLPNDNKAYAMLQMGRQLNRLTDEKKLTEKKGFVFFPADRKAATPPILISPDAHIQVDLGKKKSHFPGNFYNSLADLKLPVVSEKEYLLRVEKLVRSIWQGKLEKAILSRIHLEKWKWEASPLHLLQKLAETYPKVMVYFIYLPGIGSWMGASPELLLQYDQSTLKTISLAGTRAPSGNKKWGKKELHEHEVVSRHIQDVISRHYSEELLTEGPNTFSTGKVEHLQTTFELHFQSESVDIGGFLSDLHPTPAIVGQPMEAAKQMIAQLEKHDRAYYTGFLGPVNMSDNTQLFVNLRCMQLFKHALALYVGGGITADSVPENEWDETCLKAETLLSVLRN